MYLTNTALIPLDTKKGQDLGPEQPRYTPSSVADDDDSDRFAAPSTLATWYLELIENKIHELKMEALKVIQTTIAEESVKQQGVMSNLVRAAESAVARYDIQNERGAALSMKRYKAYRADCERSTNVIQQLQELHNTIANGDAEDPTLDPRERCEAEHIIKRTLKLEEFMQFVAAHADHIRTILDQQAVLSSAVEDELIKEIATGELQTYIEKMPTTSTHGTPVEADVVPDVKDDA
jgi:hypothetical protein